MRPGGSHWWPSRATSPFPPGSCETRDDRKCDRENLLVVALTPTNTLLWNGLPTIPLDRPGVPDEMASRAKDWMAGRKPDGRVLWQGRETCTETAWLSSSRSPLPSARRGGQGGLWRARKALPFPNHAQSRLLTRTVFTEPRPHYPTRASS